MVNQWRAPGDQMRVVWTRYKAVPTVVSSWTAGALAVLGGDYVQRTDAQDIHTPRKCGTTLSGQNYASPSPSRRMTLRDAQANAPPGHNGTVVRAKPDQKKRVAEDNAAELEEGGRHVELQRHNLRYHEISPNTRSEPFPMPSGLWAERFRRPTPSWFVSTSRRCQLSDVALFCKIDPLISQRSYSLGVCAYAP